MFSFRGLKGVSIQSRDGPLVLLVSTDSGLENTNTFPDEGADQWAHLLGTLVSKSLPYGAPSFQPSSICGMLIPSRATGFGVARALSLRIKAYDMSCKSRFLFKCMHNRAWLTLASQGHTPLPPYGRVWSSSSALLPPTSPSHDPSTACYATVNL